MHANYLQNYKYSTKCTFIELCATNKRLCVFATMSFSITILVVIPLFLGCTLCCKAQETVYDDYDENSNETAGCIGKYRELNSYILKQQDILDQLTEAFFRDGEDASQFVKINYTFTLIQLKMKVTEQWKMIVLIALTNMNCTFGVHQPFTCLVQDHSSG